MVVACQNLGGQYSNSKSRHRHKLDNIGHPGPVPKEAENQQSGVHDVMCLGARQRLGAPTRSPVLPCSVRLNGIHDLLDGCP